MKPRFHHFLQIVFFLYPIFIVGQNKDNSKVLWDAAWSSDNEYIAVGGNTNELLIFDGRSFNIIKKYIIGSGIQRISWHQRKNVIAVAASSLKSRIIDIETGEITLLEGTGDGTRSIAWNYDGKLLASANYDKSISIYREDGSLIIRKNNLSSKSFLGIDWNPTKNEIVTLSDSIRIFDEQLNLLKKFKHRDDDVIPLCVKWHPSGIFFAVGDYGHDSIKSTLQFWRGDKLIFENKISNAEYRNISWTKDGTRLATASDALRIWSKQGRLLVEIPSKDFLWGVSWKNDGKYIVTSGFEGLIKVWDSKGKLIRHLTY